MHTSRAAAHRRSQSIADGVAAGGDVDALEVVPPRRGGLERQSVADVFKHSLWILPLQMIEQDRDGQWVGLWLLIEAVEGGHLHAAGKQGIGNRPATKPALVRHSGPL